MVQTIFCLSAGTTVVFIRKIDFLVDFFAAVFNIPSAQMFYLVLLPYKNAINESSNIFHCCVILP